GEGGEVEEVAFVADAAVVHDIELGVAERGGDLVLDHAGAGAGADGDLAFLDGLGAADVDADGGVELEGAAAGGGFGVAEHDADLFANLVDEDHRRFTLRNAAGELAEGLG